MGFASLLPGSERDAEPIEPRFPELTVFRQPIVKLKEGIGFQRIEPPLAIGPHRDEPGLMEDAQVAGHAGLMNADLLDKIVDLSFTATQRFHDAAAGGIGQSLKGIQ